MCLKMWFLVLLVAVVASGKELNDLESDSTLDVLRCCGPREELDRPYTSGQQVRCSPTVASSPFQPNIYSPDDGDYLKSVPTWWRLHESRVPNCAENQVLRYFQHSRSSFFPVLFESGLLIPEEGVNLYPPEYCLGTSAIMACMPRNEGLPAAATMQPRIRKCCGVNAAYEK